MSKNKKIIGILCTLSILCTTKVYAGTFSGGFGTGKLTYGVGGGSSSIAKTAASQWNGVSSKVSLTYTSATDKYGSKGNIITYFDSSNAPTAGALGYTYVYKSWTGLSGSIGTTSDRWVKAVVYQYKSSYLDTTTKKTHTATHELGHALSVAHPNSSSTNAVMQQGARTSYKLQPYDKNNLISKWGK